MQATVAGLLVLLAPLAIADVYYCDGARRPDWDDCKEFS